MTAYTLVSFGSSNGTANRCYTTLAGVYRAADECARGTTVDILEITAPSRAALRQACRAADMSTAPAAGERRIVRLTIS